MSEETLLPFDRARWGAGGIGRLGSGEIGGKASGLLRARNMLATVDSAGMQVGIPTFVVLGTGVFDAFVKENRLGELPESGLSDPQIALAFQQGNLPADLLGDLHALVEVARVPLAVRSSSLLEDALHHPFAGIYETKMIPNNAPDAQTRFRRLIEAIKFVFASTYFRRARTYARAVGRSSAGEKMAVIVQEVVGLDHGERFYPNLSGVARSLNVYPHGLARREEGVVSLAFGLGKTIVEGGLAWTYSPAHPASPPPLVSIDDRIASTQSRFWAINMGPVPAYDPVAETEFLVQAGLETAEFDGTLGWAASTYDAASDRLVPGIERDGARILDFSPLLELGVCPVNDVVRSLLAAAEAATQGPVELEFAATFPQRKHPKPPRFALLQMRPMLVGVEPVEIDAVEWTDPRALVVAERTLGNGVDRTIEDVIYVKRDTFDAKESRTIAEEVDRLGRPLFQEGRGYLLIGFGRWGSTDPWLGIPVTWDQIAGAKAIVEGTLASLDADPSQGAHFFQNMTAFGVMYFSLGKQRTLDLDWKWLDSQNAAAETPHVRHVRLRQALTIKADGRTGRGGIWRG